MNQKNNIRSLFGELDQLPSNHVVFLPPGKPTLDSEYMALDPDILLTGCTQLEEENHLSIEDILDIRDYHYRQNGKVPTESELLDACAYYLENEHLPEH
ncbi:MAG: hypothetical protein AAF355_02870 [Myxococcota bacterium]